MNKLKVFTFSLLLFFTVALVPTFAEDNTYRLDYQWNDFDGSSDYIEWSSDYLVPIYYDDNNLGIYNPTSYSISYSFTQKGKATYDAFLSPGKYAIIGISNNVLSSSFDVHYFDFSTLTISDTVFFSVPDKPILSLPIVQATVLTIPDLLTDLLAIILPVGLAILGLVLGVSLVKRLVRLFL